MLLISPGVLFMGERLKAQLSAETEGFSMSFLSSEYPVFAPAEVA
jgi:hypothetical protein